MASNVWRVLAALSLLVFAAGNARAQGDDQCVQPEPVCNARAAVFPISSFDPAASAVRISRTRLVTNRHVVADARTAKITTSDGRVVIADVVPSGFDGDLVIVETDDLGPGPVFDMAVMPPNGPLYVVGWDVVRKAVWAYPPGRLTARRAGTPRARLHHSAFSQPGNSGGALVDATGALVGIVAAGGEGRYEAIPESEIDVLERMSGPVYAARDAEIGGANRRCMVSLEKPVRGPLPADVADEISVSCAASANRQLFDLAAQALARGRQIDRAVGLSEMAVMRDPGAVNSRLTLVAILHIAGRYGEELEHLRYLIGVVPQNPAVARYALQAGKWAGDIDMTRKGLELVRRYNPAQVRAAERFLKADIPPPGGAMQ